MENIRIPAEQLTLVQGHAEGGRIFPDENGSIRLRFAAPKNWAACLTLCAEVDIASEYDAKAFLEFCSGEECLLYLRYFVLNNCRVQVPFPVDKRTLDIDYAFLPPQPGVFKGGMSGRAVKPEEIEHFDLVIEAADSLALYGLYFTSSWQPQDVQGKPLVDAMGQCLGRDWEGKTHSLEELADYLRSEREWAKTHNQYPEGWSRWGGWLEKKFEATGWFRAEHDGRRWWLVDPDGYAYFSNAMCYGNRTGIYAMADHMESLYEWLPPHDGLYKMAWCKGDAIPQYVVRNGLEAAKTRELVNMPRANMMRVFGEEWLDAWIEINTARMKTWGINSLGVGVNDYEDEPTREFLAKSGMPFLITFKFFALTRRCIFRDFPDVFSPEYEQAAREMAERELGPWRNERGLVGYFITNEPEWWFAGMNLCGQLLKQEGFEHSRKAFIDFLKERYADIGALNAAWGASFASFDDFHAPVENIPDGAAEDLEAFHHIMVEKYSAVVSAVLREYDPHHLNLGMRYARPAARTLGGAQKYFDVFSFNRYGLEAASVAAELSKAIDLPIMVGEWHIGARDSGLDSWGLYYTETQAERAQALTYYMEQSTQEPHMTGIHYFEYSDQPYLGRFDGERHNIGLIDVCNRPYPLVAEAFKTFAEHMYPMLDGRIKAETQPIPIFHRTAQPHDVLRKE